MQNRSGLIITGGWAHDFQASVPSLVETLLGANISCDIAWDVDQSEQMMLQNKYDIIVGYACWFQMNDSRYSAEQRGLWARSTSEQWNSALQKQKDGGAGLLAVHTSVISFEDSTTWANWVGGSWNWGVSNHPQPGDVQVAPCASHPIVDGVEPFVVHDERYMHVTRAEDAEVLTESIGADGNQASMWALAKDGSRSVYSALGHDQLSFSHPTHQLLLRRAAAWVVGEADEQVRSIKS